MTQLAQGVFITDQLFLPRYIWFKMNFSLPQIKEKIQYFTEIKNIIEELRILYNKGAAKIKHLANLSRNLSELKMKIGAHLFDMPQMDKTGAIITN